VKPDELFGVGIRLGGVALLMAGLMDILGVLLRVLGLYSNQGHTTNQVAMGALFYSLFGGILLLGADLLVRLIYRHR
jgi:hypothetical protein